MDSRSALTLSIGVLGGVAVAFTATVITVPSSLWRAAWAIWVVWLAWSSIGWGRWAWRVASEGGWLRSRPEVVLDEAAEPAAAPTQPEAPTHAQPADEPVCLHHFHR